ncbi:MAG: hypothetical protein E7305_09305 [Butyrivibrio sp.]|nr:hypothetical protein [Butyrivibrio sp.]
MSDNENIKDVQETEVDQLPVPASDNTVVADAVSQQDIAALVRIGKKQLFLQRITTLATVGIFVVVLVAMVVLVPKVTMTLTNIDQMVADASSSVENINAMVAEMTEASKNLNQLVNDNTEPLTQAVNNMAGIDFEGLNKAITDLQATVGPMAQFFSRFR